MKRRSHIDMNNEIKIDSGNLERKLWDVKPSLWEKTKIFGKECKGNAKFEAICIGACEVGEFFGEFLAYNSQIELLNNNMNLIGFIGAISFGGAYAFAHTFKHGKGYPTSASLVEASKVTATTEAACVGSASGVQSLASKYIVLAATQNPLDPINLGVRVGVFPGAFGVGTLAMSSMTLSKKNEASRVMAPKGKLKDIAEELKSKGYQVTCDEVGQYGVPGIRILGENSYVDIVEQKLPGIYGKNLSKDNSMYRSIGSMVRYSKEAKEDLANLTKEVFGELDFDYKTLDNPFAPHSNDDSSSCSHDHSKGHKH
jgi:hypothetical protein